MDDSDPIPLPDKYRTSPVASRVIQHQHAELWEENCRLRAEVRRLTEDIERLKGLDAK